MIRKNLIIIVAAIMLVSFAAVPPAQAIIEPISLGLILAGAFAVTLFVTSEVVKNSKNEPVSQQVTQEIKTKDNLKASNEP
jgi:ABC-type transport system involved in multi-copper enzyme maturation permease subunit